MSSPCIAPLALTGTFPYPRLRPASSFSEPTQVECVVTRVSEDGGSRAMLPFRLSRACCIVAFMVLAPAGVRAADRFEVIIERDVQAKMRDGVTLRSDVCRPKGGRQISGAVDAHAI